MLDTWVTRLVIHGSAGSASCKSAVSIFDRSPCTAPPRPVICAFDRSAAAPWRLTAALIWSQFSVPDASTRFAARIASAPKIVASFAFRCSWVIPPNAVENCPTSSRMGRMLPCAS